MWTLFQILFCLALAAIIWFLTGYLHRKIATKSLLQTCRSKGVLALTYDDGPSETLTQRVLEVLDLNDAKATFFVLGNFGKQFPKTLDELKVKGHAIGSHTFDHSNAWKTMPWRYARDVRRGNALLSEFGINVRCFRPPFGKSTLGVLIHAIIVRQHLCFWTTDSQDSWNRRPITEVVEEVRRKGGGVVLMHDRERPLRGPAPEQHADYVVELTRSLIKMAKEENLKLVGFDALV